jgi:Trk-type K+ transport system membrane component
MVGSGNGFTVTGKTVVPELHPAALLKLTLTDWLPGVTHVTVMLLVPDPDVMFPPGETIQT